MIEISKGREIQKEMFFKILKKDLHRKKSLNLTIFLFIMIAATLAAVSVAEIYSTTTGLSYTYEVSHIGDFVVMKQDELSERDQYDANLLEWADSVDYIDEVSLEPMLSFDYHNISFSGCTEYPMSMKQKTIYVGAYPKKHNFVYDIQDQPFSLKDGEIAISNEVQFITDSKIGDTIQITTYKGNTYEFTISHIFKDTLLPMGYSYNARFLISDGDMEQLKQESMLYMTWCNFSISSEECRSAFISDYSNQKNFLLNEYIDTATWKSSFDMQMSLCLILMVVSIFLLIIVFITLRFTIISSVQEDYSEIGMMKAVGIPRFQFKLLYLAKYTAMAVVGSFLGFLISIPCSNYLNQSFSTSLIVPNGFTGYVWSIFICLFIVVCIVLFCFFAVKKTDRMSVVDAIRSGKTGERYTKAMRLYLFKRKRMEIPLFLAISSLLQGIRRYIFLFIAYILGMALLLIPFHIIHSIMSPDYLRYWGIVSSDLIPMDTSELYDEYINTRTAGESVSNSDSYEWFCEKLSTEEFPLEMYVSRFDYYDYCLEDGGKVSVRATFDIDTSIFTYDHGTAPILENEIAVSALFAERYHLGIGSIIRLEVSDYNEDHTMIVSEEREFVITALFETMDNNGIAIHMGSEYTSDSYWNLKVHGIRFAGNKTDAQKQTRLNELQEEYGKNTICKPEEYMEISMEKYMTLLNAMKAFLTAAVTGILFLMTYLFHDVILSKETGEIAVMKSMGIHRERILSWQCIRMFLLALPAIMIGTCGSISFGETLCNIIFRGYGLTSFQFVIDKATTYVFCPLLLLTAIMLAVILSCRRIRKIQIQNMNEE